jgi:hypothetical protein
MPPRPVASAQTITTKQVRSWMKAIPEHHSSRICGPIKQEHALTRPELLPSRDRQ